MTQLEEHLEQILVEQVHTGLIDVGFVITCMEALGHMVTSEQVTAAYLRLEQRALDLEAGHEPKPTPGIKRDPARCPRCRVMFPVYVYTVPPGYPLEGEHAWNVTRAIEISCSKPREIRLVPRENTRRIVERNGPDGIEAGHLDHVDPAFPGIAVPFLDETGGPVMIIIDGNHRAARCIRDNLDFYVYYLDLQESEACQMWSPTKPLTTQSLGDLTL